MENLSNHQEARRKVLSEEIEKYSKRNEGTVKRRIEALLQLDQFDHLWRMELPNKYRSKT